MFWGQEVLAGLSWSPQKTLRCCYKCIGSFLYATLNSSHHIRVPAQCYITSVVQ